MINRFFYILPLITLVFLATVAAPKISYAFSCKPPQCGCCAGWIGECKDHCVCVSREETGQADNPKTTIGHITDEFRKHRQWMLNIFFRDSKANDPPGLLGAMKLMTNQLTSLGVQQVEVVGTFFDAKHQLETQRLFQQLTARAHKDYHPSEGLCEFGTITRSLSASSRNTDLTASTLSRRSVERQLLAKDTTGTQGQKSDQASRLVQFIKKYCNKSDNAKNLDLLCQKGGSDAELFNRDVNYTTTVDSPLTLDIDFSDEGEEETEDENAIFALGANLFSHNLFPFVSANKFVDGKGEPNYSGGAKVYMDARSVIAKRSVASNSLASITALKTKGDEESKPFIYSIIKEMGADEGEGMLSEEEIKKLIGEKPSYYAQMEILTKKLYQNPNFYADLYDKPTNVLRKDVALQAATLMQKRDLYRSYLRSEMILAVMLETELIAEQKRVTNEVNKAKQEGKGRSLE